MADTKLKIMVSSSVYGFENELDQICPLLERYGYEVLNSHYNTIRVNPTLSNKENCLKAVEECDLFLGIIRPYCGSGMIEGEYITISEIKKAIELKKPYWFLAHGNVVFARKLLQNIKLKSGDEVIFKEGNRYFNKESVEIYENIVKRELGNWIAEFYHTGQILDYIKTQFSVTNQISNQ